jgi:hypothetical protein
LEYEVRMRNLILSAVVFLVACGGSSTNAAPANDPSTTNASAPSPSSSAATGSSDATASDGKCATPKTSSATALDACLAECEPLADKAPEGTRCIPPKSACKMNCNQQFKK